MTPIKFSVNALTLTAAAACLTGCMAGKNTSLAYTRSNIGLDVGNAPPAMELSVARREGVLQPTFEGGATPAFIAGFESDQNFLSRFAFGVNTIFAGGKAGVLAAAAYDPRTSDESLTNAEAYAGDIVSQKPHPTGRYGGDYPLTDGTTGSRFFLATDTLFGLKASWDGGVAAGPSSVRVGFNRSEFAWAPVGVRTNGTNFAVTVPSFIATLDTRTLLQSPAETNKVKYAQFIATGRAAEQLAKNRSYAAKLLNKFTMGEKAKAETSQTDNSKKLRAAVLGPNPVAGVKDTIGQWIQTNHKNYTTDDLLSDPTLEAERTAYLTAHPLPNQ